MSAGTRLVVETGAGPADVYLTGEPGRPGVLFFVDAIGLRPRTEEMADRIAGWGYTVLVPHVFHREGTADELAPREDLREDGARERFFAGLGSRIPDHGRERARADAPAWLAALREHAAPGRIGTTGYCMGARLALHLAGQFPDDVAAVGGFHGGGLVTDGPDSPHREVAVAGGGTAYVFGHADADRSMPPEAVAALGEALADAGAPASNAVYAGAPHGYSMSDTSMYDAEAAERHFRELDDLLARTLR